MSKPHKRTDRLKDRVALWAIRLKVKPRIVRIQRMTRKWGSCSTAGTITLAADLKDQETGFRDFVIVHELLHLRVPNHGRLFKALMIAHVPNWRKFDMIRRNTWRNSRAGSRVMPALDEIEEVISRARAVAMEYFRLTGKPLGITGEINIGTVR